MAGGWLAATSSRLKQNLKGRKKKKKTEKKKKGGYLTMVTKGEDLQN
jgi:hypothetical protein